MTTSGADIILHHYEASPFSEKVRLALGLKGAAWRSVITPNMMPKPDLVPLTGGYRRAPVMQIGADIFCDSQLMLVEIDRRFPSAVTGGPMLAVNYWSDRILFPATVAIIFGQLGDRVDPAFIADREKLSGRPFDPAAMKATDKPMRAQWRAGAAFIEQALQSTGLPFLTGAAPGLTDVAAHMNIGWLSGVFPKIADDLLTGLDRVRAWSRGISAIGHGTRAEMSGQAALDVAKAAQPAPGPSHDANDPSEIPPGGAVIVAADDYGRDHIAGRLVAANAERVVIARETPALGRLHLHFPRTGYTLAAA
jgi:glutathione S-transferase